VPVIPQDWYLGRLCSACIRLGARIIGRESAWECVSMRVPERVFGPGSQQPFASYFEGESSVPVHSIDDIVAWLQGCEYVTDLEQFNHRDVWQHPGIFERRRRGDCEDFALWAWRKLAELGIDAEFCVGRLVCADRPEIDRQHAWVVYRVDGAAFLFEPAAKTRSSMIRLLENAMDRYVPHFAVNHRFETNAFVGCADDSRRVSPGGPGLAEPV
jgi:hypothetical protein